MIYQSQNKIFFLFSFTYDICRNSTFCLPDSVLISTLRTTSDFYIGAALIISDLIERITNVVCECVCVCVCVCVCACVCLGHFIIWVY